MRLWFNRIMWFIAGMLLMAIAFMISGCSWQGQRHHIFQEGKKVLVSEWWSMRFLWMSNGIECYTETPYYKSGANITESKNDPNSVDVLEKSLDLAGKVIR